MHVTILGRGPLAEPLSELAKRAGHTVGWAQEAAISSDANETELLILAGSSTAVEGVLASVASFSPEDVIVVDASTPTQDDRAGDAARPAGSGTNWIAAGFPRARIVRAFASVPAEALAAVLARPTSDQTVRLSVPLAGNDRQAKVAVAKFMREIGVDPFDVGALTNAGVIDPGGALWGKALNPVEMLEAVGWLSGDG